EVPAGGPSGAATGASGGRACCQEEAGADGRGSGDEERAQALLACAGAGGAERSTHIRRTRQPGQSVSRFAKWLSDRYRRGPIPDARMQLGPAVLLAPWPVIEERARKVLAEGRTAESHVFNLGHGVLPDTDPDVLARLTDLVHTMRSAT